MEFEATEEEINGRKSIIYVTNDTSSSVENKNWTLEASRELLKVYDEKMDLVESGIINTRKKMWELVSKAMTEKKFYYTSAQCENKWKSMKRAYSHRQIIKNRPSKRSLPFEREIGELMNKHSKYDMPDINSDSAFNERDVDPKFYTVNLNHPPGPEDFSDDEDDQCNSRQSILKTVVELKEDFKEQNCKNIKTVKLHEKSIDVQDKICKYLEVLQERVDQNVNHLQLQHKAIDMQDKMCKLLDVVQKKMDENAELDKMKLNLKDEVILQMEEQNKLFNRVLEKFK